MNSQSRCLYIATYRETNIRNNYKKFKITGLYRFTIKKKCITHHNDCDHICPKSIRHISPQLPCRQGSWQLVTDLLVKRQTILTCQDVANKSATSWQQIV